MSMKEDGHALPRNTKRPEQFGWWFGRHCLPKLPPMTLKVFIKQFVQWYHDIQPFARNGLQMHHSSDISIDEWQKTMLE